MKRRDMLLTTGSMVVSASLGALACGGNNAGAQNAKAPPSPPAGSGGHGGMAPDLTEAAYACIAKGQTCLAHCIGLLAAGDTTMSGCAPAVHDMHAVMLGLAAASANGSKHLKELARVAMEFCKDCEAECRKHADKHLVCKECMEACQRTIAACQKVIA
jgi:Cys-rich four helix bundle protein (predicted Tat secretion target)